MTWKELRLKCKALNADTGKTWINSYCFDFTKNHKIVHKDYGVIHTDVEYADMLTVITILEKGKRYEI